MKAIASKYDLRYISNNLQSQFSRGVVIVEKDSYYRHHRIKAMNGSPVPAFKRLPLHATWIIVGDVSEDLSVRLKIITLSGRERHAKEGHDQVRYSQVD